MEDRQGVVRPRRWSESGRNLCVKTIRLSAVPNLSSTKAKCLPPILQPPSSISKTWRPRYSFEHPYDTRRTPARLASWFFLLINVFLVDDSHCRHPSPIRSLSFHVSYPLIAIVKWMLEPQARLLRVLLSSPQKLVPIPCCKILNPPTLKLFSSDKTSSTAFTHLSNPVDSGSPP